MTSCETIEAQRFDLAQRVVVITGCTGVLGSTYSRALAMRGASLVLADLEISRPHLFAERLAQETGANILGLSCDVSDEDDVVSLFCAAIDCFGRVDVVLNNAAATGEHLLKLGNVFAKFEEYPLNIWEEVIKTNLTGVFLVAREGGKAMLASGGGSLINVSSIYGVVAPDHRLYDEMPFSSFPAYSSSKAGVHGLTLWLSTYWARSSIRVNTLVPGGVYNNHSDEFMNRYSQRTPMGRMACSDDLVGAVVFLASDASIYVTGQQLIVDGGFTAW